MLSLVDLSVMHLLRKEGTRANTALAGGQTLRYMIQRGHMMAGRGNHGKVWLADLKRQDMRAHHVHAVTEDDLSQLLPAHYAEVVIIVVVVFVGEICLFDL